MRNPQYYIYCSSRKGLPHVAWNNKFSYLFRSEHLFILSKLRRQNWHRQGSTLKLFFRINGTVTRYPQVPHGWRHHISHSHCRKDTPRLHNTCAPTCLAQVANGCAYGEIYGARMCKGVQLKSKFQHPGAWSGAAWPSRRLCCRPALFFRHLCLTALPFLLPKIRRAFKKRCGPGSSVSIVTDYGLDGPGSNPDGTRFSDGPNRPLGPRSLL